MSKNCMEIYANEVKKSIEELLPEEVASGDLAIVANTVVKQNDATLYSITFKKGLAGPTYYINEPYDLGVNVMECAKSIVENWRKLGDVEETASFFETITWDKAKDRLSVRLVNSQINEGFLKDKPTMKAFCDLVFVADIRLPQDEGFCACVVTDDLLESFGKTREDLFEAALTNAQIKDKVKIIPLEAMTVVTTYEQVLGAAAIAYPGVAGMLYRQMGEDYYIIPSSVNEVMVVPAANHDVDALLNMLRMGNSDPMICSESDILSHSIYRYDGQNFEVFAPEINPSRLN